MHTQKIIELDLPSDILLALNENELNIKKDIKISYAMRLYQLEKLTLGKAAQIAGTSRLEFENILAENQIPISNLTLDEVLSDLKKLK